MQELNQRSLSTAPYGVSNAILPPPDNSVENVVAPTQATTRGFILASLKRGSYAPGSSLVLVLLYVLYMYSYRHAT